MDRWRCIRCETLNDLKNTKCIVCDFSKVVSPVNVEKKLKKCAYVDCNSMVMGEQKYCEYHRYALCPICNSKLKSSGLDYCIDCGLVLVEKNTSALRKTNGVLKIVDIVMLSSFIILLLTYLFYFN